MKAFLKSELYKVCHSPTFWIALLVGFGTSCLTLYHACTWKRQFLEQAMFGTSYEGLSLVMFWLGGSNISMGNMIFYIIFPLLSTIPYSWSLFTDINSGYVNQILTRSNRKSYLRARFLVTFLAGGAAIVIPMVLNLMMTAWVMPSVTPSVLLLSPPIEGQFLSHLFYKNNALYIVAVLVTEFFWGGTLACIGLTAGLFVHSAVVSVLMPFLIMFSYSFIQGALTAPEEAYTVRKLETDPFMLLQPWESSAAPAWYLIIILVFLIIFTYITYSVRGNSNEML